MSTITILTATARQQLAFQPGETLLHVLRRERIAGLSTPCGGKGTCGKCLVTVRRPEGEVQVLACQTPAEDGLLVRLPENRALAVALEGSKKPSFAPDAGLEGYGIACDIGTTTVVCHLLRLSDGARLATVGEGNAQRPFGGDVIARIQAAAEGHLEALSSAIRQQLREMCLTLCAQTGIAPEELRAMTVAANTTMCHLLTGLDPKGLGQAPFTPLSRFGDCWSAKELSLPFEGEVYLSPAVSGYVGGDITAGMLAAGLDCAEKPVLFIDIGTNGEMALGCGEHFICCSTAAGPAFEGAQIACGMTAADGAISAVEWQNGKLQLTVLGGGKAKGLCGSGLIDAMALLLRLGVVDETGRMLDPEEDEEDISPEALPYLFLTEDESPAFRLTGEVYVTQADVRKLQLGKGAIAAGVQVLLKRYGASFGEIGSLLLAGGFGSFIRPESAARIGLIPAALLPVTQAIGNAAAEGAALALVSQNARARLLALREHMAYLELSGLPAFNEAYMEAMLFPEEDA